MASWIAQRFHNNSGWTHQYTKNGSLWTCDSLHDAFCQYEWNGLDWKCTKAILDTYRTDLQCAFNNKYILDIIDVCDKILTWGHVKPHNSAYLHNHKAFIIKEIQHMKNILFIDQLPSNISTFHGHPKNTYRMNAGFMKIYSLLCDYRIMYDSRVAAALGLLVRNFCNTKKYTTIPHLLKFGWCAWRKPGNNPTNRNPNQNSHNIKFPVASVFPRLSSNPLRYTRHVMKASWILELALTKKPNKFSTGQDGFHELAAGLFMIGYDI